MTSDISKNFKFFNTLKMCSRTPVYFDDHDHPQPHKEKHLKVFTDLNVTNDKEKHERLKKKVNKTIANTNWHRLLQ